MANTYADYTGDGSNTDFAINFPYLKDTHVIVSVDGTEYDKDDGQFNISTTPTTRVVFTSGNAPASGTNVRVKRNSLGKSNTESALVDYNDGSVLTEKDLDDAYLHNFYLSQEAVEGAAGGMSLDSSNTSWDAQNKKIINVNDPTNTKDAANKTYVDTQINNTVTGSTTEAQKWTFTGDNTASEFTFSPAITLDADTAYTVAIDGVMQEPTTAYTIDADNDTITFTSAPPTSSNIVVIARGYSVPVTEGAGTVTSVTAGNGLSGGTITSSGTVSIPTSGGDLNISGGKVGLGGDVGVEAVKVTGDLKVSEGADHTILTVENTNTSGTNNATAVIKGPGNATLQLYDTDTTGTNDAIYNLGSNGGEFNITLIHDDHVTTTGLMSLHPTGSPEFPNLPTTDPSTAGYLWNDGGVVSVSGSSGFSGSSLTLGTKQTFTSSSTETAAEFTSIPSGVTRINLILDDIGFSTNTTDPYIQIGDSGGYETSNYSWSWGGSAGATSNTSDGGWKVPNFSTHGVTGVLRLERIDDYTWLFDAMHGQHDEQSGAYMMIGRKTLSGTLDRIRVVSASTGPSDTLATGSINISYI